MLERIDDYWNIEGNRDSSDSSTGFTRFTFLEEKPPNGYTWSGRGRLTKKQKTSRPDCLWPEIWKDMSEAAQRKEKQKWAIEKPTTLENCAVFTSLIQRLRSSRKLVNNAWRKLEVAMPAAMPCKIRRRTYNETCKTKYACIVEADESTRKRLEGTLHKDHEDHLAGKGSNSLNHYNLVHKFIPMPKAMKIPGARAAVDK